MRDPKRRPRPTRSGGHGRRIGSGVVALGLTLLVQLPFGPPALRAQGTLSAIEADVDQIASRVRPSIVTVIAQHTVTTPVRRGMPPSRRLHSRVGSGVAVGPDEVLTTASVVLAAEKLLVVTEDGSSIAAQLVGLDPVVNVALVRAPGLRLTPVAFASRSPQLGDWVIALGSSYRGAPTQSVGNISNRYREPRSSLLELTNEVYPGNSGGAAVNSRGELIGLVQGELGAPSGPGATDESGERRPGGISFAIPVDDIQPALASLRRDGRVHYGFLGVSTRAGYVDSESDPSQRVPLGAIVESIQTGGPAEKLGLRKGDLIVAYEGERVEYPEQLARWVAVTPPGTNVDVVWAHNELRHEGRVALSESPTPIPSWMMPPPGASDVGPASGAAAPNPRIADLEAQIKKLSRELDRLRGQQDSSR